MKLRNEAIKEINNLAPDEIIQVYDIILAIKNKSKQKTIQIKPTVYKEARKSLKNIRGNLSDDILSNREERI